jgi:hypothetical protein
MSMNSFDDTQTASGRIFNDYSVKEGASRSLHEESQIRRAEEKFNDVTNFDTYSFSKPYKIPLNVVRSKVSRTHNQIQEVYDLLERLLNNVYINPNVDPDMEECHFHLWEELNKNNKDILSKFYEQEIDDFWNKNIDPLVTAMQASTLALSGMQEGTIFAGGSGSFNEETGENNREVPTPNFISFKQYLYAEEHGCRGCRKFVKEYDKLISHSIFVHLFDFRYYLKLLLHESNCIKESLLYDFGAEYEDESQQQAAIFYFSWAKMAENHTRLITEELNENSDQIPSSEVDLISKKQAAQFQAFFSIRVAAYTESIDNLLFSMKKYLLDTCHIFYTKYVSPSLKFKSQVAAPLELDLLTTSMRTSMPTLAEEVVTAVNSFKGNFGSILTDMVQRRNNIQQKFDNLLSLNIQRKKYISYIDQLSIKASPRPKIIINIDKDIYSFLFDQITIDESSRMSLSSIHGNLDSLNDNDHPQYLMRSGGTIFGDIIMAEGVTIDGVDIDTHAHTGEDGSVRIKSTDIDYETPRGETTLLQSADGSLLEVSINAFESSIKNGGVPTVNAVVNISIPDSYSDKYEYEIVYLEAK